MKAKEYAQQYINATDRQYEIGKIWNQFVVEIEDVAKMRNALTNSAWSSIFEEQNMKWKAFCREVKKQTGIEIKEDGFKNLLLEKEPRLAEAFSL